MPKQILSYVCCLYLFMSQLFVLVCAPPATIHAFYCVPGIQFHAAEVTVYCSVVGVFFMIMMCGVAIFRVCCKRE